MLVPVSESFSTRTRTAFIPHWKGFKSPENLQIARGSCLLLKALKRNVSFSLWLPSHSWAARGEACSCLALFCLFVCFLRYFCFVLFSKEGHFLNIFSPCQGSGIYNIADNQMGVVSLEPSPVLSGYWSTAHLKFSDAAEIPGGSAERVAEAGSPSTVRARKSTADARNPLTSIPREPTSGFYSIWLGISLHSVSDDLV